MTKSDCHERTARPACAQRLPLATRQDSDTGSLPGKDSGLRTDRARPIDLRGEADSGWKVSGSRSDERNRDVVGSLPRDVSVPLGGEKFSRPPRSERTEAFDGSGPSTYKGTTGGITAAGEGSLQWGPCEPGQGGNTAAISLRVFVWGPLAGGRAMRLAVPPVQLADCPLRLPNPHLGES